MASDRFMVNIGMARMSILLPEPDPALNLNPVPSFQSGRLTLSFWLGNF
jgi:hypothetical protein